MKGGRSAQIQRIMNKVTFIWKRNPNMTLGEVLSELNSDEFHPWNFMEWSDKTFEANLTYFIKEIKGSK